MALLEQEQIYKQITEESPIILPGVSVAYLPERVKLAGAFKVSNALAEHPFTMLPYSPEQILESMDQGRSVIALGKGLEVVGFAQIWKYGLNEDGQQILEFGSWLSFGGGCGEGLLLEAVCLGKRINPTAQIVAIVEQENIKARAILSRIGAEEIGSKFSPAIRTVEGESAFMKIFDVTTIVPESFEGENRVIQKNEEFKVFNQLVDDYIKQGVVIPEEMFQRYKVLDYWLSVNHPGWKSRYGFPSMKGYKLSL